MERYSILLTPTMQYLFMMFYWINEKWSKIGSNLYLKASNNQIVKSKSVQGTGTQQTAHGNEVINPNDTSISKYIWRFKFVDFKQPPLRTIFGIEAIDNDQVAIKDKVYYCGSLNGYSFTSTNEKSYNGVQPFEADLDLILNMDEKKLIYVIKNRVYKPEYLYFSNLQNATNGLNRENIIATNIDFKGKEFNLAVRLLPNDSGYDDYVHLQSFKIVQKG